MMRDVSDVSTFQQNLICLNLKDIFQDFSLSEISIFYCCTLGKYASVKDFTIVMLSDAQSINCSKY